MHYERKRVFGDPNYRTYRELSLTERIEYTGWEITDSGCWEWRGCRSRGYGVLRKEGINHLVHRLVYTQHHGPIPEGHVVRHTCDNPPCINPDHLLTGTQADNVRDAVSRRRFPSGPEHWNSKLSADQISEIRTALTNGATGRSLATLYSVSEATISYIRNTRKDGLA